MENYKSTTWSIFPFLLFSLGINFTSLLSNGASLINNPVDTGFIWIPVEVFNAVGDGTTDDHDAIQNAINSGGLVSLTPGKVYLIESALQIDEKESLYIPANSTLLLDSESESTREAIIMTTNSTLAGKGTIQSLRYYSWSNAVWNTSDIKTAIRLKGTNCNVEIGFINGFEYGISAGDESHVQECNVNVGRFYQVMYPIILNPDSEQGGWVNQNYFHWNGVYNTYDNITRYKSMAIGIYMDGTGDPSHNTFSGSIEDFGWALKLSGSFNRFLGFRAENCDYTVVINNRSGNTAYNTIFGEYGGVGGFYNYILNAQTGYSVSYAVQIYGPEGENRLGIVRADNYYTYSDSVLKKNIHPIDNALNKVLALRGTRYQLQSSKFLKSKKVIQNDSVYTYGFIAQELKEVLPEIVQKTNPDSLYTINYQAIIPILVEALKAINAKTKVLDNKIDSLSVLIKKGSLPQRESINQLSISSEPDPSNKQAIKLYEGNKVNIDESLSQSSSITKSSNVTDNISPLSKPNISIYPNPTDGIFYIKSSNYLLDNLRVFDSPGILIFEKNTIHSNSYQINLSNFPEGVYYVNIMTNNQIVTRKIIKNQDQIPGV
jgi:hypothetical protein